MCKLVENKLRNYNTYLANVKNIELQLENIDEEMSFVQAKQFNSVGHSNAFSSSVENYITTKEYKIKELEIEKRRNQLQIDKIDNALSVLDSRSKDILIDIYIHNRKLDDIAYKNYLSYSRILQIKRESLKKIEKYLVPTTTIIGEVC